MIISYRVVNNKKFFIGEWGTQKEVAVVGIHGLTANAYHMSAISEFLHSKKRHVLAYDLRSRGDSDPMDAPSSMYKHAVDAKDFVEALPAKKVVLLGYSMGAFVAAMAAEMSEKIVGMVFLDGGGVFPMVDAEKLVPSLSRMDDVFDTQEAYIERVKANYDVLGLPWTSYIEAAVEHEIAHIPGGTCRYKGNSERIQEDLQSIADYDHESVYKKIACPVLLVHAKGGLGQGAPLYSEESYKLAHKHIKNLTFHQIEANHYTIMLQKQPKMNGVVDTFLTSCGV